jgi:uracil-DNA glycosylase
MCCMASTSGTTLCLPPPSPAPPPPPPALFVENAPIPGVLEEILAGPALSTAEKKAQLAEMNATQVSVCRKCRLCESRTQTVFGEGDPDAKIVFIGEGPGETEDQTAARLSAEPGSFWTK